MKTNCVIICMGRTGSTLLVELLDSHPDVEFRGELFRPGGEFLSRTDWTRREYLERGAYRTQAEIRGFKMPFDWIIRYPGIFDDLEDLGYRAILLHRRNLLSHFVSAKLAGLNQNWASQAAYPEQELLVDKWELSRFFGIAAYVWGYVLPNMTKNLQTLTVYYEDLLHSDAHDNLLKYLGARPAALSTQTVKARTRSLRDVITNYDELAEFFFGLPDGESIFRRLCALE